MFKILIFGHGEMQWGNFQQEVCYYCGAAVRSQRAMMYTMGPT